ncbi:MAG: hypothetical protein ACM3ZV_08215 [Bacillota bacterium]
MPLMFVAALMLAQAAAPAPAAPPAKKKISQICETIEVTGSRRPQRVCHDRGTTVQLDPNVANEGPNPGMFHPVAPAAAPAGVGGTPH